MIIQVMKKKTVKKHKTKEITWTYIRRIRWMRLQFTP